ncbi:DUF6301 family protein [Nocardia sp. NPDC088792]|uniref:DUF6301 family protein n=1 Tax=Nocardia sp. NPDC088792 TaxID=3364332 RepID=UPI0037F71A8A
MHVEVDAAIEIARAAAGFEWSWTVADLEPFCRALGWQMSRRGEKSAILITGLAIDRAEAVVFLDGSRIREILVWVSDIADSVDAAVGSAVVGGFEAIQSRLVEEFGLPPRMTFDEEPSSGWDLPRVVLIMSATLRSLCVSLINPESQRARDEPVDAPGTWGAKIS